MATSNIGFDGSVDEIAAAALGRYLGADYSVAGPNDWKVTAVAGQDRTVSIAAGVGYGHFVLDTETAPTLLQLGAISSGKRWDLVCRRRTWSPPGGTSVFYAVQGQPASNPAATIPSTRANVPGQQDDQPIALVQLTAGQTTPSQIIDLRAWSSKLYQAGSLLALPDPKIGTAVEINGERFTLKTDGAGNPLWISARASTVTTTGVVVPQSGFAVDAGMVNQCVVSADGKEVEYRVMIRRSGAALRFAGDGSIADTPVADLKGPTVDSYGSALAVQFRAVGGAATSNLNGVPAWGYLSPAGRLTLEAGLPSNYLVQRAAAATGQGPTWSLAATIKFRKA